MSKDSWRLRTRALDLGCCSWNRGHRTQECRRPFLTPLHCKGQL